ncbi:MAG: (d)CMP kinase [Polyangiaceae bacterium]|nr:(d)CMP kinase [Polyangiaceae bacterium]
MKRRPIVAIDGPAGAGKTTVSQRVAQELGYVRLDTGALYRCVALASARRGIDWSDDAGVTKVAEDLAKRRAIRFQALGDGNQKVMLDTEDVSVQIRDQAMGQGASRVSAIPGVRSALLDMQRIQGSEGGVVLEGRDIGTVVFPDAEAKFFLTASPVVRAERRYQELVDRGQTAELEDIIREVKERDTRDSQRPVAPLKQADDAELVDSSNLDIEEVVIRIVERVRAIEVELGV